MFIPLWQDMINQSQEIPETMMTQRFFSEVNLIASMLVPIVAIHPLGGSHANRHHTPNPQSGAAQSTQDEDPQVMSNPLEYLFALRWGKSQEPLTITTIGAGDKHHPLLNDPRCTKLSRWRQPPRVTSEIHSETQSPSIITKCL
jgi:hypothetical protein